MPSRDAASTPDDGTFEPLSALDRRTASDRSLVDELLHERKSEARALRYEAALERIAAPKRPDGTYNLSREACEQIAREALRHA